MEKLYEVALESGETVYARTANIEQWVEEYEEQFGESVTEYDTVEELKTGLEGVLDYIEWWAA